MTSAATAVDEAADLILNKFDYGFAYADLFRFALAVGQRASFRDVPRVAPILDVGVNDGSTARILHHGKTRITWGGDMPEENTHESRGLFVTPDFNRYDNLIGMDVCDIPFPDNSFNTVVSTEVFFYGMDRSKLLSEIVRVLAPGGTLAFSESSPEILKFPAIAAALKNDIPTFNVPEDPRKFYDETLTSLGMTDFFFRPYFDSSIAALTLYINYGWPPGSNHWDYMKLVQTDPRYRALHREGLDAIKSLVKKEFESSEGPQGGWNVFVTCKKPGQLTDRPPPSPMCVLCKSTDLDRTIAHCKCKSCGHEYQTRFGTPFVLRDPEKKYSPKTTSSSLYAWTADAERRIDSALSLLQRDGSRPFGSVVVVGVDPSTRFIVARLQQQGIRVQAVCSEDEHHIGEQIDNIQVIGLSDLHATDAPLLLTGYSSKLPVKLIQKILSASFKGRMFVIANRIEELLPNSPTMVGRLLVESVKGQIRKMPHIHRALVRARQTMGV